MTAARRKISNEEATQIGLEKPAVRTRRKISPDEAASLGLETPPAPPEESGPSTSRALALGATQGGSFGFGDELYGALSADMDQGERMSKVSDQVSKAKENGTYGAAPDLPQIISTQLLRPGKKPISDVRLGKSPNDEQPQPSWKDDYRTARDSMRAENDAADAAHPVAYNLAQFGGSMVTPTPGAGKSKGLGRLIKYALLGGGMGAASSAGHSKADLTKNDDVQDFLLDSGMGGAIGAPLGAAGGKLGDWLSGKGSQLTQAAEEKAAAMADKPIDAAIASARGKLGGEVSAGNRGVEVVDRLSTDPRIEEELSRTLGEFADSPEAKNLLNVLARSSLGRAEEALPRIAGAKEGLGDAVAAGSPELREAAKQAILDKSPVKKGLWTIAKRVLPTMGGYAVDKALGGNGAVGGVLGSILSATGGQPGRIMRNAVTTPAFQRSLGGALRGAGDVAPALTQGAIGENGELQSKERDALAPYLDMLKEEK